MNYNLFYIKSLHRINNIKLKAFVLGLGKLKKSEFAYENCDLTKMINQKMSDSPEKSGVLLELSYIHKQYHDNAEKIIELKQKKPKEAAILYAKLKDDSHYIVEQILKF